MHASSPARFQEAYQDIAERLQLTDRDDPKQNVLQLVFRWLTDEENGPWLLVIDNVDDKATLNQPADLAGSQRPLASYIPKIGRGFILVTSRNERAAEMIVGDDKLLLVPAMEDGQAKDLLRAKIGPDLYDDGAAAGLVEALDRMPLAIVQATSFIKRRSRRKETIQTYLKKFQNSKEDKSGLLATDALDLRRDESASKTVLTAWQMTFEQVRRERESAIELLLFMSFCHPQRIPDFVLQAFCHKHGYGDLEGDIEVLTEYALISPTAETHMLEMHVLVQFCTQAWLSSLDDLEAWRCKYMRIMSAVYPFGEFENWVTCRKLQPHVQQAIQMRPAAQADIWSWAKLLKNVAAFHYYTGEPKEAETLVRLMVETKAELLGSKNNSTLDSMSVLAAVLLSQEKLDEAEVICRQTLDARMQLAREDHPDVLVDQAHLASVLRAQGNLGEAERLGRQTIEARRDLQGAEHRDTTTSMNDLAAVLWKQGNFGEAKGLERKVLEADSKVSGDDYYDTLASMHNLALILTALRNYQDAEQLQWRALDGRAKTLGRDNLDSLDSMKYLAESCWAQNKRSEARQLLQECLSLRERRPALTHPDIEELKRTLEKWELEP